MDHTLDTNSATLIKIAQTYDLPVYVKSAVLDTSIVPSLPSDSFAWVENRRFPCHTRADTFLSYAYFLKNASDVPETTRARVFNRLCNFAAAWSITGDCEKLRRDHEQKVATVTNELPDSKFAICEEFDGQQYKALPLLSADHVKRAATHMIQFKHRYPYEWRIKAAAKISEAAQALNVTIDDEYINTAKATGVCDPVKVATALLDRSILIKTKVKKAETNAIANSLLKIAKFIANNNDISNSKLELLLDAVDVTYGLTKLYGHGLDTPEEVCRSRFTIEKCSALQSELVTLTNGASYSKSSIKRAGIGPFRVLGDDFIESVTDGLDINTEKIATILPTLPQPDANLIQAALKQAGIKPIGKIAACNNHDLLTQLEKAINV